MKKIKTVIIFLVTVIVTSLSAQESQSKTDTTILKSQLPKVREFGFGLNNINLTSFNNFSLQYRWGNEKRLYRLAGDFGGTLTTKPINTYYYSSNYYTSNNNPWSYSPSIVNCRLSFSILRIKSLSEKFGLMYGNFFSGGYSNQKTNIQQTSSDSYNGVIEYDTLTTKKTLQSSSASVGFVLGAVYKINSSFLLYAEIGPGISYSYNYGYSKNSHSNNIYPNPPNSKDRSNSFSLNGISNSNASLTIVYRITK